MSDATGTLIAGGLVTLAVSFTIWQFQQGGRRKRKRHRLGEELDLLAKLNDRDDLPVQRLKVRVDKLLEQYEPDPHAVRVRRASWFAFLGTMVVTFALYLLVAAFVSPPSWTFLPVAALIGVLANVVDTIVVRRMEVTEQNEAVHQVIRGGVAEERDEALPGRIV